MAEKYLAIVELFSRLSFAIRHRKLRYMLTLIESQSGMRRVGAAKPEFAASATTHPRTGPEPLQQRLPPAAWLHKLCASAADLAGSHLDVLSAI